MANLKLTAEPLTLKLKRTFTISRGSRNETHNLLVRINGDGIEGIGEAAPNTRYHETPDSAMAFLSKIDLNNLEDPFDLDEFDRFLEETAKGEYAAKAAVEMAVCDWIGKKKDMPLHRLWNAPRTVGPHSSVTIGIDTLEEIKDRVEEAENYPVLKVKLGSGKDRDVIKLIRELTDKTIWVDANEGWHTYEEAASMVDLLVKADIKIIEQPMPADKKKELEKLKSYSPIPIIADEGFTGKEQLEDIAGIYDGINIKLMKIGSMNRALKIIAKARKLNLKIMIGCMVESSLANTAAAIISQWADYADLDGSFLIADDPFTGFKFDAQARVTLNDSPGLGVKEVH